MKCNAPPGTRTRRSSRSATPGSGMVHSVQVDTALSKRASGNGSDWPSRPDRTTGTSLAATRLRASRQPTSEGSTAASSRTVAG